jgi:hypothetical protein
VGELEEVTFDLDFALSYEAKVEHNLALTDLLATCDTFPPPEAWLMEHIRTEWANDLEHLDYVLGTVPVSAKDRELVEGDGRDLGHEGFSIQSFLENEKAVEAGLTFSEVVTLRLYTGPGYRAINASTRSKDDRFCVTCFVLEMAIIKLGQHCRKATVLRGLKGNMPARFQQMYKDGVRLKSSEAIADPGFLSATRNLDVATSGNYKGNTLFLITGKSPRPGLLRSGADVAWVSQFPAEEEVLFPQFTELWYAMPDKRDPKLDKKFGHLKNTKVYQFGARVPFDQLHNCPRIPGWTG